MVPVSKAKNAKFSKGGAKPKTSQPSQLAKRKSSGELDKPDSRALVPVDDGAALAAQKARKSATASATGGSGKQKWSPCGVCSKTPKDKDEKDRSLTKMSVVVYYCQCRLCTS